MLNALVTILTFRTFFVFASTAFSIGLIMLFLNIITVDEIAEILNLSAGGEQALRNVVSRIQEVTNNVLDIISHLLTKLFSWSGTEIDLNKIKVDIDASDAAGAAGGKPPVTDSVK